MAHVGNWVKRSIRLTAKKLLPPHTEIAVAHPYMQGTQEWSSVMPQNFT